MNNHGRTAQKKQRCQTKSKRTSTIIPRTRPNGKRKKPSHAWKQKLKLEFDTSSLMP